MKFAYKYGKVKDLEEAFDEYPVEEEWYKGKLENVINDVNAQYGSYDIGDIVFVDKFNYSTGAKGEKHFFVIIDKNN